MEHLLFDLASPRMTLLHRVGLAGLWMTLNHLETHPTRPQGFHWDLGETGLKLSWHGDLSPPLDWLFKTAFQVEDDIIVFPARRLKERISKILLHNALLKTFLQHTGSRTLAGSQEESEAFYVDIDKPPLILPYKRVAAYKYQHFVEILWDKRKRRLHPTINLVGWMYPGATQQHAAVSDSHFVEPCELAFLLPFASIAASYYSLCEENGAWGYAVVLQEPDTLPNFCKKMWTGWSVATVYEHYTASVADAGLKCLLTATTELQGSCQISIFAKKPWSSQQRNRCQVLEISLPDSLPVHYRDSVLEIYNNCQNLFPNHLVSPKPKKGGQPQSFIFPNYLKGVICDNIVNGRVWYHDFCRKLSNPRNFTNARFEGRRLRQMLQAEKGIEQIFVSVCHDVLRQFFGRLYAEARENGNHVDFGVEVQRLYAQLKRGKSLRDFRKFLVDFWRRGHSPLLEKNWQELWDLINQDWERARDLTVLSFCSYSKRDDETGNDKTDELIPENVEDDVDR